MLLFKDTGSNQRKLSTHSVRRLAQGQVVPLDDESCTDDEFPRSAVFCTVCCFRRKP